MRDPGGKGIYFINGKSSGTLSVYDLRTKTNTDISGDRPDQPTLSRDGKRLVYLTRPEEQREELWVSQSDGSEKSKLADGKGLGVGNWTWDGEQISYWLADDRGKTHLYVARRDGSRTRELPLQMRVGNTQFSHDGSVMYASAYENGTFDTWKIKVDGSAAPELVTKDCGVVVDQSADDKFLLTTVLANSQAQGQGIYALSLADRKCNLLAPDVASFVPRISPDGKSVVYTVSSRGEVMIYRQPWADGKPLGKAQVVTKLPFAFAQSAGGNAYDVAADLSKVVYVRPSGQFDLYLLSSK